MTHLYTKTFNFQDFLDGAKFGCLDESSIRVICKDRKTEDSGVYPIVALVEGSNGAERLLCYKQNGEASSPLGSRSEKHDLVMIPLGFCEGVPVYTGDILYHKGYPTRPYTVKAHDQLAWDNHVWSALKVIEPNWKEVFFPHCMKGSVQDAADNAGYPYYALNGIIYNVNTGIAIGRFE